ncbi:lytic transglycosylase domain-containing protein [Maritimibacter sp. 55A14]|uniref:lytic transglycosylase domain-containing protein n=1 Tax=Maritimibacter sp. 55A14 TaxID=2174844 RepID=UPI0035122A09
MRIGGAVNIFAVVLVLAVPARGQSDPPPFKDFTFKRVTPPKPGQARRITIQIDPEEQAAAVAPPPATPRDDAFEDDWFWKDISPALDASGPGRLQQALKLLTAAPMGIRPPAPSLEVLRAIADAHGADILRRSVGTRVSPALVLAVIGVESSGRAAAVSTKGATGLMQLMPDTAARFAVRDATDPVQNIAGGVAYLDWLLGEFGGDPLLALAAYNAGEGALRSHDGVPPYSETRAYVPKVLAAWQVARLLCATPPELISDGCVFSIGGKG